MPQFNEVPTPNVFDALHEAFWHEPTPERIAIYKTIGLSGAAVCLAVLLAATQFQTKNVYAYVAIYAATAAMPVWFYFAGIHDYYLLLGSRSYGHLVERRTQKHLERVLLLGGAMTVVALAGLAGFLAPYGALVLGGVSFAFLYKAFKFHVDIAGWWSTREPEKPSEPQ